MADSLEPAHISRMRVEKDELDKKIEAIHEAFTNPEIASRMNRGQTNLLNIQSDAMMTYSRILAVRIEHDHAIWERDNAVEPNEPVVGATTENTDAEQSES